MASKLIPDDKLYQLNLEDKKHQETRRDEVNNFYITMLSGLIAAIPFVDKATAIVPGVNEGSAVRIFVTILSLIGLALSTTWAASVRRVLIYTEILDQKIFILENKYEIDNLADITKRLEIRNASGRITRYQLLIPNIFRTIFAVVIIYSLLWIIH